MGLEILLPLLFGALSFAVGTGVNIWQNKQNKKAVEDTNAANLQAVRETNQSNVEQADLAYQRSLPINQVRNLMDAGMSRAGAIQSLSGGGTYQAPVLQSATANAPQMDFSGVMSAIERLNNIPSNVEQYQLVQEQREALRTDTRIKEERAIRERELHDAQMFEHIHGRKVTEAVDNLASKVINYAADNNIDLDSIDSPQKMVSLCKLQNDPDWRDMPAAGRLQLFNAVRLTAQENRSNLSAHDSHRAADDAHKISQQSLKDMKAYAREFDKASSENDRSRALSSLQNKVEQIATARNLTLDRQTIEDNFVFDSDGNIVLENGTPKLKQGSKDQTELFGKIRGFWNDVADVLPVNVLSALLRFILKS